MIEETYNKIINTISEIKEGCTPYARRFLRFIALPYCYVKFVNWEQCTASKYQVAKDFFYIFFKLKYFPENYGYCRLWEKDRSEWKYYYGSNYDAYQRHRLKKEVQKSEYQILFDDKEVCQQLCDGTGLSIPKCFGVITPSEDYRSKLDSLFKENKFDKLIIKPARGSAGKGIFLAIRDANGIKIKNKKEEIDLDKFKLKERCIVQESITQDEELSRLASSASMRLISLCTKSGDVILLSGEINMGVGNTFLSNWSSGGLCVGVDIETGRLGKIGYDKLGRPYTAHPTSNILFKDLQIPKWKDIVDLAIKVQKTFSYYKLLGSDIALSKDGPMLYEINACPDLAATEQVGGPLLKNRRTLHEFKRYNLLISRLQRNID